MKKSSPFPFLCNKNIIYIRIRWYLVDNSSLLSLLSLSFSLSLSPLLCSNSFINYLFNWVWCLYRKILNQDRAVLIKWQQGQYGKAEVWDFPITTEHLRLIGSRLYGLKNKIKTTKPSVNWSTYLAMHSPLPAVQNRWTNAY